MTLPLAGVERRYSIAISVPDRRLVAAAIALGLVGSTRATDPQLLRDVSTEDLPKLEVGACLRVIAPELPTHGGHNSGPAVRVGIVAGIGTDRRGRATITIDTRSRHGDLPQTYVVGEGGTRFQLSSLLLPKSYLELSAAPAGLSAWVDPGDYADFALSVAMDLSWVGTLARIEPELDFSVARASESGHTVGVALRNLIRPLSGIAGSSGWHTRISSSQSDGVGEAFQTRQARVQLLDGNSAISRHTAMSRSPITILILDAGDRTKQLDAINAVREKARWSVQAKAGSVGGMAVIPGTQQLVIEEEI
jgi:hypothetical protein